MSKNTVRVYDTITKKYVEVEVNETVRTYYDRTQWNIEDNDKSFYKHEIQFSALKGNINGELENFKEFRTDDDSVEKCIIRQAEYSELYKCLASLPDDEHSIIIMIYFCGKTEQEVADILHTLQQNVHKKKHRILCRLNKFLKSQ
jgi:RNA polymerase sigma factor (sigma-70 family)